MSEPEKEAGAPDATTPAKPDNLYVRLARVMGSMSRIPKNGTNPHFKYKFASNEDVLDYVRTRLAGEGIAFTASMVGYEREGKKTTGHYIFTFINAETGETSEHHWYGEADDTQDKGLAKAHTSALKYFLLKFFMLSAGDEPDSDRDGPSKEAKKPRKKKDPPKLTDEEQAEVDKAVQYFEAITAEPNETNMEEAVRLLQEDMMPTTRKHQRVKAAYLAANKAIEAAKESL